MKKMFWAIVGLLTLVQQASADWVDGRVCRQVTLVPQGSTEVNLPLRGSEATLSAVSGSAALQLFLFDEFGNLIASDMVLSDYWSLAIPQAVGRVTIRIVNPGVDHVTLTVCVA